MKIRSFVGYVGGSLAATMLATVIGLSAPAYANTYTFFTPAGAVNPTDGQPVSAEAIFTTSTNQVTLQLINLLANPTSISQLISDIFFTAGGLTSGTGGYTPSATYINVATDGTVSAGSLAATWQLSNTLGTYHLTTLGAGTTGPAGLIIGPAGPGGVYTNANSSIAGNDPHNPFANQSATFTLALAGATAATVISNVVFSFGTTPGDNVAVPIPAAVWLFASGLVGLIGIARRKRSSAQQSVAA